jgi:hypothetical protein
MRTRGWKGFFTTALTLTLSPGERGQRLNAVGNAGEPGANSGPRIAESRRTILPLLGERAGVREEMCFFAILLLCASSALSQYTINWHTIDGGGGTSTGGVYSVSGTLGQPDAGGPMTGGNYSLTGGFWSLFAVQTPGAPLLSITAAGPGQATISWSPDTPGFVLQETLSLSPAEWTNSPSGSTNPIVVPATLPTKFYRLFKP